MARYLLTRSVSMIFVLFIVSVIAFSLMHAVPGGPFDEGKQRLPDAAKANILRKYGLDQPVWKQYLKYMWSALHFDFGIPYQVPTETVASLIRRTWFITVQVGVMTVALAFSVGIVLGTVAAYRRGSWIDTGVTFIATSGVTLPNFVVAFLLILLFAYTLKILPSGGWNDPGEWLIPGVFSKTWILPVLAYALAPMAVAARYTRSSMLEALQSDWVRTARAKGLRDSAILRRHVLKNAAIPMVTVLGPMMADLMTGSIFIEAVFRIPGLGKYFVTSTFNRDYPMIMALVLIIAVVWALTYMVTDILHTYLDPRVRLGAREQ
jgi:peptide/nickel transport system permease protein